jgi:hypothetical protein
MNKDILKSKTFWAGVLAVLGAVAGYLTGEMPLDAALSIAVPAVIGVFLKDGMLTQGKADNMTGARKPQEVPKDGNDIQA